MRGEKSKEAAQYMTPDFNIDVLFAENDKEAIKKYRPPDPKKEDNFKTMKIDPKTHSGKYLVFPSG